MRSLASTIWRSTRTAHAKATRHHDRRLSLFTETLERRQTPTASPLASLYADPDPQLNSGFGTDVVLLPNGNVVVSAPFQDITGPKNVVHQDAGAVYLFDGRTGNVLATLIGTSPGDRVGSGGITQLANGSYVVASPHWDNVSGTIEDAGAVTWRPGSVSGTPVVENVSTSNSLHGTSAFDLVGISSNSGFDRKHPEYGWDSPQAPDLDMQFYDAVTPLPNGNYVVSSPWWDNGTTEDAGAVTLVGDKGIPVAGQTTGSAIATANSLHGTSPEDHVGGGYKDTSAGIKGLGITPIAAPGRDPTFVVSSPSWTNPDAEPCRYATRVDHGAVTFVNGRTGHVAGDGAVGVAVVASNSVHGQLHDARIGAGGVTPLARHGVHTGAYVISSPLDWFGPKTCPEPREFEVAAPPSGAATWVGADGRVHDVSGATMYGAEVTDKNSLRGPESLRNHDPKQQHPTISAFSRVSSGGIVALADGNYAVVSPEWNLVDQQRHLNLDDCGAVTFGDGTAGTRGFVTTTNSLYGSGPHSRVGSGGVTTLDDGSYFVGSPAWDRYDQNVTLIAQDVGAVTLVGRNGQVTNNSGVQLLGTTINPDARDRKTWNSLAGETGVTSGGGPLDDGDQVGSGGITKVRLAGTDYYAVSSPLWNRPAGKGAESIEEVGAVTLLKATGEVIVVDPRDSRRLDTRPRGSTVAVTNSLHGDEKGDRVGSGGVTPLVKGNFVVNSPEWRSGKTRAELDQQSGGGYGGSGPGGGDAGGGAPDRVDRGAATWVGQLPNGTFRGIGMDTKVVVSASNSLVGSTPFDQVGSGGVVALATGHYAVVSPAWDHNGVRDVGAVTWGSGTIGAVGTVRGGTGRTLHGSTADDGVGSGGVTPLSDGSYVVASPHWSSPDIVGSSGERIVNDAGAVTRIGPDGLIAPWAASAHTQVSTRNSLVGTDKHDRVGSGGVTALAKGHYLVTSPEWGVVEGVGGDRGAITWVAGGAARRADVTPANSRFGQVTEPGIILDNRNGRFLVGLREATPNGGSNNRVVAGWQTRGFVDVQASTEAAMAGSDTRRSSPSAAAAVPVVAREAAFAALGSLGTEAGAGSTAATTGGPTARTARSVVLRR